MIKYVQYVRHRQTWKTASDYKQKEESLNTNSRVSWTNLEVFENVITDTVLSTQVQEDGTYTLRIHGHGS